MRQNCYERWDRKAGFILFFNNSFPEILQEFSGLLQIFQTPNAHQLLFCSSTHLFHIFWVRISSPSFSLFWDCSFFVSLNFPLNLQITRTFQDLSKKLLVFQDWKVLENARTKFQDFAGFQEHVQTLELDKCFHLADISVCLLLKSSLPTDFCTCAKNAVSKETYSGVKYTTLYSPLNNNK